MDIDLELGAIVDLAKELVAGGQREAAGILLKTSMEPLRKAFQDDFLADIAASTRALAKARGIPFETKVTQQGAERVFIFKTGYHEVEHRAHGHEVQVNLRKTIPGSCPFKDLALAKAIQIKLQRVYAQMGDSLMAKTEELLKSAESEGDAELHLEAAKWHKGQSRAAGEESPDGQRHYTRAMKHLGAYNAKANRELSIDAVTESKHQGSYPGFRSHEHDRLIAVKPLAKAKVDEKKTRWISEEATPRIKRAMRQTRKEQPGDPLAAKKPAGLAIKKAAPIGSTKAAIEFTNALRQRYAIEGPRKEVPNFGDYQKKPETPSGEKTEPAAPPKPKLQKGDVIDMGSRRGKPQGPAAGGSAAVISAPKPATREEHQEAFKHHLHHAMYHQTLVQQDRNLDAIHRAGHHAASAQHFQHAVAHARRLGWDNKRVQAEAGQEGGYSQQAIAVRGQRPQAFTPHDADPALGSLVKGDVVDLASRRKPKPASTDPWHEPSAEAQAALATNAQPAPVIGKLISPDDHMAALEHHVDHLAHHNLHHLKAVRAGKEGLAMQHEDLANQHYNHALTHAKRIGRGKHDIAFMQGMISQDHKTLSPEEPILVFKPHPHDEALGGRLVTSKDMNKSIAAARGAEILLKAMHRRRPPRTKRALGRHKRTQGVWAERSKLRGKQSQAQATARRQTQATQQSSGIMGAIASLFGG